MNLEVKIFNKIVTSQIEKYSKNIIHHDQKGFIQEMQECFNVRKRINAIHHINKHFFKTSLDAQNAFDEIQHPFMIKKS